ncbi:MAG TPA: amidohydrolase family protein [bacterium]|nr:amidohydrolase family protein [bacterium]
MRSTASRWGIILIAVTVCRSQIALVKPPSAGFEQRISHAVHSLRIIDTHEHLLSEKERLDKKTDVDFTLLFSHYTKEDLISAANEKSFIEVVFNNRYPIGDRWSLFAPYWEAVRTTGYGRASWLAVHDLYGIDELNESSCIALTEKLQAATQPGLYRSILKEKAGIDLSLNDVGHNKLDPEFFRSVERFDQFIDVSSHAEIKQLCRQYGASGVTLAEYTQALRRAFQAGLEYGMVGVKSGLAYNRILKYEDISQERALEVFGKLERKQASGEEIKAFQDYMMHRVLDLADEFDLPVQIHTGLQAGNGNLITNSHPVHLVNLFMEYPDVTFCLFHGAYPYGPELGALAKNFPNVYIDLCWDYVISPSYSMRNLHEWLETVPSNKIMAFGGDYSVVELVYSHAVMARRCVTEVLTEKVRSRYMTEAEALGIAERILRTNALRVFKLAPADDGAEIPAVLQKPGPLRDWWRLHRSKEGFVKSWQVIGPFETGEGLDQVLPPEKNIDFSQSCAGLGGQVRWQKAEASSAGYLNFLAHFARIQPDSRAGSIGMVYAYTEIESPDDRQTTLTIGSNDGAKVWLNGQVIYNEKGGRNAVADHDILSVHLRSGINRLLVKVQNLGAHWGLYVRVVDSDGKLKNRIF